MSRRSNSQAQPLVQGGQMLVTTHPDPATMTDAQRDEFAARQAQVIENAETQAQADAEAADKALDAARDEATEAQATAVEGMLTISGTELEKIIAERVEAAMRTAAAQPAETVNPSPAAVSQAVIEETQRAGMAGQAGAFGGPRMLTVATEVARSRMTAPNGTITEVYEGRKPARIVLADGQAPDAPRIVDADGDGEPDE